MSDRKTVLRYFHILNRLRKSPASFMDIDTYLHRQSELQDENFNVSKRQFARVIRDIQSIFELDIEYNASRDVYFIREETESDITQRRLEALDTFQALKIGGNTSPLIHFEKRQPQGTENMFGLFHAIKNTRNIKFTYTLAVCQEKLINFSGDNEIYLLNKSRMSSIHRELRSFCFFKNFIEPERYNYYPFTKKRYFGSSNYDKPCAVLDKFVFKNETYKIDIHFNKDGKYIISLFIDEAKGDEQELLLKMVDFANLKMNWGEYKRFFLSCKDEADTKNKLDTICTNLKELADTENTVPNEIPI